MAFFGRHQLYQIAIRVSEVDRVRRKPIGSSSRRRTVDDWDSMLAQ
jgi:hypothetical protein